MRAWAAVLALAACGRDHFDPAHNYAFVTSTVHAPTTFGADLAGADAICTAAAADAGLLGDYVAYLATTGASATARLGNARGWVRMDGTPFVDRVDDLAAGRLFNPLRVDEHGEDVGVAAGPIATGARLEGGVTENCNDWTAAGAQYYYGQAQGTTGAWDNSGFPTACTNPARLYCFGLAYDAPLDPTPVPGRRAFVTVQSFAVGGGLGAADALCANEAALAGLSGTFLALLPTSTASASARFDLGGPTWVRVDGIPLADSPFAFVAGELTTSLSVTALGTDVTLDVTTGGMPGLSMATSCGDWTDSSGGTERGLSSTTSLEAFTAQPFGCAAPASIYCLEP